MFAYQTVGFYPMSNLKDHIIGTALFAFLQKGYKEVTMKELVERAGASKGAFYHYFTSKEQVFEEVVLQFYRSRQIDDYATLSKDSLFDFYRNWIARVIDSQNALKDSGAGNVEDTLNHYYLLFDGLRLIPSFRKIFEKKQKEECRAWIKIIEKAKETGEIRTNLPADQIARLFMYSSDGSITTLITQSKTINIKSELESVWDSIYALIKG